LEEQQGLIDALEGREGIYLAKTKKISEFSREKGSKLAARNCLKISLRMHRNKINKFIVVIKLVLLLILASRHKLNSQGTALINEFRLKASRGI